MNPRLDNSFPCTSFQDKSDLITFLDEKNLNNSLNLNFMKIFNDTESIEQPGQETNLNLSQSQSKKKIFEDMSYSIDQPFYENSHINIEEEFRSEENYLKIGNEDQSQSIDPIQEENCFEQANDSFLHENNYLIHNLNDVTTNSFDNTNVTYPELMINNVSALDETELNKIKKNIISLKLSKSTIINYKDYSKDSKLNKSLSTKSQQKQLFTVSVSSDNLNGSFAVKGKKGRKKFLLDGVKTEIIDKAYIREFKKYLKAKQNQFRNFFDEEPSFWNDFFARTTPPFYFTNDCGSQVEFKSFSKSFLKMIFSKKSARVLYGIFIKEKEKELFGSILSKRIKKMEPKMLMFYKFYGKNLHKLYSDEYNVSDINCDDLEMSTVDSVNMSL